MEFLQDFAGDDLIVFKVQNPDWLTRTRLLEAIYENCITIKVTVSEMFEETQSFLSFYLRHIKRGSVKVS